MHFIWSAQLVLWRIFADFGSQPFPPLFGFVRCKYEVRWVFSTEFPSVWRCQLAAACRGGCHLWGCYGYLLAMPELLRLSSNLQGTSSQAHLGDEFDNYMVFVFVSVFFSVLAKFLKVSDNIWSLLKSSFRKADFQPVVASCWGGSLKSETKHLSCYLWLNIATFSAVSLVRLFWVQKLMCSLLAI